MPKKHKKNQYHAGFPKAAVDYIDALLDLAQSEKQRNMQLCADQQQNNGLTEFFSKHPRPSEISLGAEDDAFIGGGWSSLQQSAKPHRWMQRVGSLLLFMDLTKGAVICIQGPRALRPRFLKGMTVWLNGHPIEGRAKSASILACFTGWKFEGYIPPTSIQGPYARLEIKTTGLAKKQINSFGHASLAIDRISIHSQ